MAKRESGFYWVMLREEWMVARYSAQDDEWSIPGSIYWWMEHEFDTIGEQVNRALVALVDETNKNRR